MSSFEHSVLDVAGVQNEQIHHMWSTLIFVCGFMYILVLGFLFLALARGRRLTNPEAPTDEPRLDMTLRIWTAMVVVGLLGITFTSYAVDRHIFEANQQKGLELEVNAQQWWWDIKYHSSDPSQSFETANEIHLPVGVPVRLSLHSPDVIHSFWVPNLHGKQDLIPGRDTDIHLQPTRTGTFRGQCAEFCGAQHANMSLYVVVESQQDFDRWRAKQLQPASDPGDDMSLHGRDFFMSSACALCHAIRGTDAAGVTGPDLTHVASRRSLAAGTLDYNRGNLAAWISDPQGIKPGNHMPIVTLGSSELQSVTAYLDGLK